MNELLVITDDEALSITFQRRESRYRKLDDRHRKKITQCHAIGRWERLLNCA